jgi:hypothetical protein
MVVLLIVELHHPLPLLWIPVKFDSSLSSTQFLILHLHWQSSELVFVFEAPHCEVKRNPTQLLLSDSVWIRHTNILLLTNYCKHQIHLVDMTHSDFLTVDQYRPLVPSWHHNTFEDAQSATDRILPQVHVCNSHHIWLSKTWIWFMLANLLLVSAMGKSRDLITWIFKAPVYL